MIEAQRGAFQGPSSALSSLLKDIRTRILKLAVMERGAGESLKLQTNILYFPSSQIGIHSCIKGSQLNS